MIWFMLIRLGAELLALLAELQEVSWRGILVKVSL